MEKKKKTQGGQIIPGGSDDQELICKNDCEDYTLTWIHKYTIIFIQFDYIFWILNKTQNSDTGGTQIQTQLFVLDFGTPIRFTLKRFQNFWALLLLESIFFERWAVGNWTELDAPTLHRPGWVRSFHPKPYICVNDLNKSHQAATDKQRNADNALTPYKGLYRDSKEQKWKEKKGSLHCWVTWHGRDLKILNATSYIYI